MGRWSRDCFVAVVVVFLVEPVLLVQSQLTHST